MYSEEDYAWLKSQPLEALVAARERGTENGNEHYQVYCKFPSNRRWSWWKKNLPSSAAGKCTAHWVLASGREWRCRRYIVDVEAYMRDNPGAHAKTQGEILDDFGCEVHLDESVDTDVKIVKGIVDGAALHQIFRENPLYYFHNAKKIKELYGDVASWRESGLDFKPQAYKKYRKSRE